VSDDAGLITSAANPLVKRIRSLRLRKERERAGEFFVDGIQPVWQALDHEAEVELVVVAPGLLTSEPARVRVAEAERVGIPVARVAPAVYDKLSERDHPSGLGAIVKRRETPLGELAVGPRDVVVAVEDIGNPGNLGTIVRTADGAGAAGVVVVGDATDPTHQAALKASMGTIFSVPVCRAASVAELLDWARSRDLSVVTTSARASTGYADAPYELPALLLLGSEAEGLSPEVLGRGDLQVRIDMAGSATSLNVAVAAGILLYEIKRRANPS
jgi:RNA methyltransferase, TrmH family